MPTNTKLTEAWRAAVDARVERVVVARCASTAAELEGARRVFERRPALVILSRSDPGELRCGSQLWNSARWVISADLVRVVA